MGRRSSSSKRCSRRVSNASGDSSFARAAASSIASGRPSSLTQISAIAGALALVAEKSAFTARARSTKSATDSYCESEAISGRCAGSGSDREGTGNSCSPETWSGIRLVTSSFSCAAAARSSASSGAASTSCSTLSRRSSMLFWAKNCFRLSATGAALVFLTPTVCAMVGSTSAGSAIESSATKKTP